MICILSPSEEDAHQFARSQFLAKNEYFWANHPDKLLAYTGFHVLVVGRPFDNSHFFERLYATAQDRGSRGRR